MNLNFKDYLSQLQTFEPTHFAVDALRETLDNDAFDWVNFRLLNSVVESPEEGVFQIIIPDQQFKFEWLRPIFKSLALLKWRENAFDTPPQYAMDFKPNSRWYLVRRDVEYIALSGNAFRKANDTANTRLELKHETRAELVELTNFREEHDRRTVKKALKAYFDFFQKHLPTASNYPTRFTKRLLVVAERGITEGVLHLPFQYNGDAPSLPIEPLIQVVNRWEEAETILKNDTSFDTLVVIGTPKYRDRENAILNSQIRCEHLTKILFIGSEKVDTTADITTWHWTFDEFSALKNKSLTTFEPLFSSQKDMIQLQNEAQTLRNRWHTEGGHFANISQKLLSFPLRQVVKTPAMSEFERGIGEALGQEFRTKAEQLDWRDDKIMRAENDIKQFLNEAFQIVSNKQPKYETILNLVRQNERQRVRVILGREEATCLNQLFEAKGFYPKRAKALTIGEFDRVFAQITAEELPKITFVIPHIYFKMGEPLAYYHLFQKARLAGRVLLLQYDLPLETERLQHFARLFELDTQRRLFAEDRVRWLGISFPKPTIQKEIEPLSALENSELSTVEKAFSEYLNRFFKNGTDDFVGQNENEITDWDSRPKSENSTPSVSIARGARWRVEFDNGATVEFYEGFLMVKKDKTKTPIERLKRGDEAVYFNILPDESRPVLKEIPEAKAILTRIDGASRRWHKCLESLKEYNTHKKQGSAAELKAKYNISVSPNQIENWLTQKDKDVFPRANADLRNILEGYCRIKKDMTEAEMNEILSLQNRSASLREVVTKLNRELIEYSYRKNTEGLPMLSKISAKSLDLLVKTQQTRTVKSLEKIDTTTFIQNLEEHDNYLNTATA